MDHSAVPKRRRAKNGTYSALRLHDRIDFVRQERSHDRNPVNGIEVVGKTGSHDSVVARSDLLDAFEVMEHALTGIIEKPSARVSELAKKLAKKHRPSSWRRRS